MALTTEFTVIQLAEQPAVNKAMKEAGARFVQVLATRTLDGVDLIYSYMEGNVLRNYRVCGLTPEDVVPSISALYPSAFVFENEAHDLFGVNIKDINIDFNGKFYAVTKETPMAEFSAAQAAAFSKREAAKAAEAAAAAAPAAAPTAGVDAELEAKLAGMDPEKAAKVRAAMMAKAAKAAKESAAAEAPAAPAPAPKPAVDAELEAKLAGMDPEKAAKVRAAMAAKAAKEAAARKEVQ